MNRIKEALRVRAAAAGERAGMIDLHVGAGDGSRVTRFGKGAIMFGIVLEAIEPVLTFVLVMTLAAVPCFAQGSTGGSIFGQDQSMVPNAVRQTVIFAAGIAFLVGALAVMHGGFLVWRRQDPGNAFIGGGILMSIGGVIALISYLSSGRGVTVDRTLN